LISRHWRSRQARSFTYFNLLSDLLDDKMMITENGPKCEGVDSPDLDNLIQRAFDVFNSRKQRNPKESHTAEQPERLKAKRTCDENILLERAADFSSDDVSGDEDTVIDDRLKAGLEGVVTCDCGAMYNVIDLDFFFLKMYTFKYVFTFTLRSLGSRLQNLRLPKHFSEYHCQRKS